MKTLYLKGWQYNTFLIINELSKIIKENGGKIVVDFPFTSTYEKIQIVNRSILEDIEEIETLLKDKTEKEIEENSYLAKKKEELEKLKVINNKPKKILFKNYIQFVLNDVIYYIQLQENPFFDDYIQKEKVEKDGKYYVVKYNHYMEHLSKDWIENGNNITSFYQALTSQKIKKLANNLYKQILSCPFSEIVTNKKRIQNYYDDGFHYEKIKEERKKIFYTIDIL